MNGGRDDALLRVDGMTRPAAEAVYKTLHPDEVQ